jgi:hypothetical protein
VQIVKEQPISKLLKQVLERYLSSKAAYLLSAFSTILRIHKIERKSEAMRLLADVVTAAR